MNTLCLSYELYNTNDRILAQSVTGSRIGPILEHIAKTTNEHGGSNITIKVVEARLDEKNILDQARLQSLTALVTLATEHYTKKTGTLIVETTFTKQTALVKNLKTVLKNPTKRKKLKVAITKRRKPRLKKLVEDAGMHHEPTTEDTQREVHGTQKTVQQGTQKTVQQGTQKGVEESEVVSELQLPNVDVGDVLLAGKYKNKKCVVKGFTKDENNQPVAKTNRGDQKLLKPRLAKLMPGAGEEIQEAVEPPADFSAVLKGHGYEHQGTDPEFYSTYKHKNGSQVTVSGRRGTWDYKQKNKRVNGEGTSALNDHLKKMTD